MFDALCLDCSEGRANLGSIRKHIINQNDVITLHIKVARGYGCALP